MAQAIVNPDELERFAKSIKQFNEGVQQNTAQLKGQFEALAATWRDQEHLKFAQEFQETLRALERFALITDQHVPFLLRKAQRAREYLHQR